MRSVVTTVMLWTTFLWPTVFAFAEAQALSPAKMPDELIARARRARDQADVKTLTSLIEQVRKQPSSANAFEEYVQIALLEDWLCEAAFIHKDSKLVRQAAEAGIHAAQKAVELEPKSAEAHWLLGDLVGNLIPHVFAGGMRFGSKSISELETAMRLDPLNANAYVSRAIAYLAAPQMLGGDKQKAIVLLKKAISLDPSPDTSDTAHIWLALAYDAERQKEAAVQEINEAKRLNPERRFVQTIYARITSGKENTQ